MGAIVVGMHTEAEARMSESVCQMRSDEHRRIASVAQRFTVLLLFMSLSSLSVANFEWRDVVQHVQIAADGSVVVFDERTLWTNEGFGEAFLCVQLVVGQRLTMLDATGAVSPGPAATGHSQPCTGGTEIFVRQESRVSERRIRFAYRLDGTAAAHADVVEWYWNILERDGPPVIGYELEVVAPGPMAAPFDAYVMRYDNPEEPRVTLSGDRRLLRVAFDRIPEGDGVEIRWLMDPSLFEMAGSGRRAFDELLLDQMRVASDEPPVTVNLGTRGAFIIIQRRDPITDLRTRWAETYSTQSGDFPDPGSLRFDCQHVELRTNYLMPLGSPYLRVDYRFDADEPYIGERWSLKRGSAQVRREAFTDAIAAQRVFIRAHLGDDLAPTYRFELLGLGDALDELECP